MNKKIFKFITVDNFEKEEQFLHDMSLKGWHFNQYRGLRYIFEKGEVINYVYRIDYVELKEDLDEYISIFKDAGWENIFAYPIFNGQWMYFRRPLESEMEIPEIFSDKDSMINLFKKIRKRWSFFGFGISALLIITFVPYLLINNSLASVFGFSMVLILLLLYGKLFINLTIKINKLERDK